MFSAYDRLMATLASVKSASYLFGQFGYNLAIFWVTYTGVCGLMYWFGYIISKRTQVVYVN